MLYEIDTIKLIELLRHRKINLIDIRNSSLYFKGTIDDAKNISMDDLLTNYVKYLNKDEEYYIFCNFGNNSKIVCKYLSSIGYKVVNVIGGYHSYVQDSIK